MKTRTVCKTRVLAACFLTALLVGGLGSVKAQGAWPPTPASGNDPYNHGTFTSNGRTYTIYYIKASAGADGSGVGTCTASNSVLIAISSVSFMNSARSAAQFTYTSSGSTLVNVDSSGSGNISSDVGDNSHLRRFIDISTFGGIENGPFGPPSQSAYAQPAGQTNGGLYFYYKIVASNPYSNNFGVNVDMAQGGFTYASAFALGGTSSVQSYAASTPNSSSVTLTGNHTKQSASQYTGSSPYQMTRAADVIVPVTLTNGVGYFALNAILTKSDVNFNGVASEVDFYGNAESRLEVVPISVSGP